MVVVAGLEDEPASGGVGERDDAVGVGGGAVGGFAVLVIEREGGCGDGAGGGMGEGEERGFERAAFPCDADVGELDDGLSAEWGGLVSGVKAVGFGRAGGVDEVETWLAFAVGDLVP